MNIAVCEDNPRDQEALVRMIEQSRFSSHCTVFSSGEALCRVYRPGLFDLLLLDIYMSGMTGVEAVTQIRQLDPEVPIAFVTSSTDHALEGYRLSVLKYIEKPFSQRDVDEILTLAQRQKKNAPTLSIRKNGREERLLFSRIVYLEQQTHSLHLVLRDGAPVQIYEKLSNLLPQLEAQGFFSPHKSFSVNLAFVRALDPELRCFVMQNGTNIPVRRETMGKARQALMDYLFSRTRGGVL